MFQPIKLKYKKEHKTSFKNKEYSSSKSSLAYGNYGLMAGCKGVLMHTELEAAKKLIAKEVKGIGLVFLRGMRIFFTLRFGISFFAIAIILL